MAVESLQPTEVKAILKERARSVNLYLNSLLAYLPDAPDRLREAMNYSLNAGGKRLRPVLCLTCALACGLQNISLIMPFAAAIEFIHTYSLIHDDLPAMDNDDFRRGKPSNHKQFDEATAILAGDGLLTDAFFLAASCSLATENVIKAIKELAYAAGSQGMAGGQMLDMEFSGKNMGLEEVIVMQQKKTGAMIKASCICGAILAGASKPIIDAYGKYGAALGKAFQITDDILDITGDAKILGKPVGSDAAKGKNTFPALTGIEESRKYAQKEVEIAINALPQSSEAAFLEGLAEYTLARRN